MQAAPSVIANEVCGNIHENVPKRVATGDNIQIPSVYEFIYTPHTRPPSPVDEEVEKPQYILSNKNDFNTPTGRDFNSNYNCKKNQGMLLSPKVQSKIPKAPASPPKEGK